MKNQIKINICNKDYNLVSDETQEYTDKLAQKIDTGIKQILMTAPGISLQEASVLYALDCTDNLTKLNQNMENIRSQIKGYVDDALKAKAETYEAKKHNAALMERIKQLENELAEKNALLNNRNTANQTVNMSAAQNSHKTEEKSEPASKAVNCAKPSNNQGKTYVGQVNYRPDGSNK